MLNIVIFIVAAVVVISQPLLSLTGISITLGISTILVVRSQVQPFRNVLGSFLSFLRRRFLGLILLGGSQFSSLGSSNLDQFAPVVVR